MERETVPFTVYNTTEVPERQLFDIMAERDQLRTLVERAKVLLLSADPNDEHWRKYRFDLLHQISAEFPDQQSTAGSR